MGEVIALKGIDGLRTLMASLRDVKGPIRFTYTGKKGEIKAYGTRNLEYLRSLGLTNTKGPVDLDQLYDGVLPDGKLRAKRLPDMDRTQTRYAYYDVGERKWRSLLATDLMTGGTATMEIDSTTTQQGVQTKVAEQPLTVGDISNKINTIEEKPDTLKVPTTLQDNDYVIPGSKEAMDITNNTNEFIKTMMLAKEAAMKLKKKPIELTIKDILDLKLTNDKKSARIIASAPRLSTKNIKINE